MMSLDEAIKHCEEKAEEMENKSRKKNDGTVSTRIKCKECASEHRQLAEWLRELQAYKEERVGCEFCKHSYREMHERPCSLCKHNFKDMFERGDEDDE